MVINNEVVKLTNIGAIGITYHIANCECDHTVGQTRQLIVFKNTDPHFLYRDVYMYKSTK